MARRDEAYITFKAHTGEFDAAIKGSNGKLSSLRAEMKLCEATFKETGDKAEYLRSKEKILSSQIDACKEKQDALTAKMQVAKSVYGENSNAAAALNSQLIRAKAEEANLRASLDDCTKAIEKNDSRTGQLTASIADQEEALRKAKREYADAYLSKDTERIKDTRKAVEEASRALSENKNELKVAQKAADDLARENQELADASDEVTDSFNRQDLVTGALAAGALSRVFDVARDAAAQIIETGEAYESSMSKVAALSGATGADLDGLKAKAREMGATTTFSASESADALGYMALAGWDTRQMMDGLPGVLALAQAGEMDLAAASDLVTDYLSAFGMGAGETGRMVDVLAYAQANANTTAAGLGESFRNCSANAHAAGLDVETAAAAISMMANQGLKGSEAGTALNAVLRDMTAKMEKGAIAIGEQKIQVQDAEGNYRDFAAILGDVEAATAGMGDAEKAAALQSTFTADSIRGLNLLLSAGTDEMSGFRSELYESAGTAEAAAKTMTDNLGGDLAAFNSAWEETQLQLYDALNGPLRELVQFGTADLIPLLQDGVRNIDRIAPVVMAAAAAFGAQQVYLKTTSSLLRSVGIATEGLTARELAAAAAKNRSAIASRVLAGANRALMGALPVAAMAALAAVVTEVTRAVQEGARYEEDLRRRNENLEKSTKGLEDAASGLVVKLAEEAEDLDEVAEAAAGIDMEAIVRDHIDLANSISELSGKTEATKGQLDQYAQAVHDLAGSDLDDEGLANLKIAVDGINDACGTSYQVVRDSEGAYQVMSEGATVAKDSILALVEAQKLQVVQQALTQKSGEVYAQLLEDQGNAAEAQRELTAAQEAFDEKLRQTAEANRMSLDAAREIVVYSTEEGKALVEKQVAYDEMNAVLGSTQSSYDRLAEQMTLCKMAQDESASALLKAAADSQVFQANVQACGVDLVEFTKGLEQMGFEAGQVSALAPEQAQALASAWGQGTDAVIEACKRTGVEVPAGIAAAQAGATAAVQEEGARTAAAEQQTAEAVVEASAGMDGAVDSARETAEGQTQAFEESHDATVEAAQGTAADAADAASNPEAFAASGAGDAAGYAGGIAGGGAAAAEQADGVSKQAADHMSAAKGDAAEAGRSMAADHFRGGLAGGQDSAVGQADAMSKVVADHMSSANGDAWWAGRNMARGFEDGIRDGKNAAVEAARAMARESINAAKKESDQHSPSRVMAEVGENYARGMALGIERESGLPARASREMAADAIAAPRREAAAFQVPHISPASIAAAVVGNSLAAVQPMASAPAGADGPKKIEVAVNVEGLGNADDIIWKISRDVTRAVRMGV